LKIKEGKKIEWEEVEEEYDGWIEKGGLENDFENGWS
jgi:hypothetical protein